MSVTTSDNPLLDLSFEIPFDRIRAAHVEPGISALIADARRKLEAIENVAGERTYDDTVGALDRATERLEVAMTVVAHLESVASTPELRAAHNAVRPDVNAFYASIPMRPELWTALSAYAETADARALTGARRRYLKKTLDDFKRHGALLDPAGKAPPEALSRGLAELTARFAQNVLDSTAEWELVVESADELRGLPVSAMSQASASAEKKGRTGYRFTLQAPSYIPLVTYADDARLRELAYRAYNSRAASGALDNAPVMERILALRLEQGNLLGYPNFADLVLEDRMAKSAGRAREFVSDLTARSAAAFERERSRAPRRE